jgi:hypothetical protein
MNCRREIEAEFADFTGALLRVVQRANDATAQDRIVGQDFNLPVAGIVLQSLPHRKRLSSWSSGFSLRSCRVKSHIAAGATELCPSSLQLTTTVKRRRLKPELQHLLPFIFAVTPDAGLRRDQ